MKIREFFALSLLCFSCTNVVGQEDATSSNRHRPYRDPVQTNDNDNDDHDDDSILLPQSNTHYSCPVELSQCREELTISLDRIRELESSKALLQSSLEQEREMLSETNTSLQHQQHYNHQQQELLSQCPDELAERHERIRELESSKALLQSSLEYEQEMSENALADMKQAENKTQQQHLSSRQQLKWMQAERGRILAKNHKLQHDLETQQRQTDRLQTELLLARSELLALNEQRSWKKQQHSFLPQLQQRQPWSTSAMTPSWSLRIQQWGSDKYKKWNEQLQLENVVFPLVVEKFWLCRRMLEKGWDVVFEKLCFCWELVTKGFLTFDTELRTHLNMTYPEYSSFLDGGCEFCRFVSTFTQLMQAPWPLVASAQRLHSHCYYVVLYGVLSIGTCGIIYVLWSLMGLIRCLDKVSPKNKDMQSEN